MDLLRALIRRGWGKGFQQLGMASEKVKGLKGDRVPAGSARSHLAFVFQTKLCDGRNAGVETPRGEEPRGVHGVKEWGLEEFWDLGLHC